MTPEIAAGSGLAVSSHAADAALEASLAALAAAGVERADLVLVFVTTCTGVLVVFPASADDAPAGPAR